MSSEQSDRGPNPSRPGPNYKPIDFARLEELVQIQCTMIEISTQLGCDDETIKSAVRREFGLDWSQYVEAKRTWKFPSLRRKQFELADSGDKTMLIWLGKQHLGQSDKQTIDASGVTFSLSSAAEPEGKK